jgi:hypothetical protein
LLWVFPRASFLSIVIVMFSVFLFCLLLSLHCQIIVVVSVLLVNFGSQHIPFWIKSLVSEPLISALLLPSISCHWTRFWASLIHFTVSSRFIPPCYCATGHPKLVVTVSGFSGAFCFAVSPKAYLPKGFRAAGELLGSAAIDLQLSWSLSSAVGCCKDSNSGSTGTGSLIAGGVAWQRQFGNLGRVFIPTVVVLYVVHRGNSKQFHSFRLQSYYCHSSR